MSQTFIKIGCSEYDFGPGMFKAFKGRFEAQFPKFQKPYRRTKKGRKEAKKREIAEHNSKKAGIVIKRVTKYINKDGWIKFND